MAAWSLYIIETRKGSLYTGITTDVARRFKQHLEGKGASFFRTAAPREIVYVKDGLTRSAALKLEASIKQLNATEKRRLICRKK